MYVGQTSKSIKERFGGHFYSITIGKKANLVAKHFDSQDHKVHVLGFIHNTPTSETARKNRLKVEGMWQHRLNTIRPYGLNTLEI